MKLQLLLNAMKAIVRSVSLIVRSYSAMAHIIPIIPWNLSPPAIRATTDAIITDCTATLDGIAATLTAHGVAGCTWPAVIGPLAALDRDIEERVAAVTFPKDVSTDKAAREAAAAAQAALSAFEVKSSMRLDVYAAVSAYFEHHFTSERSTLDAEAVRFVERTMRDFRRRGLHLPAETRAELEQVRTRASEICVEFQQCLGEDTTKLAFTRAQLAGLPEDFIAGLEPATAGGEGEGALSVSLAYPHVIPILQLCSVPATRAAVERAFASRGHPENTRRLESLATLRCREAQLLGYASHAAFVLEERMARSPATVAAFLTSLGNALRPLRDADLESLTALKAVEEGASAGPLLMSDYRYYMYVSERRWHRVCPTSHRLICALHSLPSK